MTDSISPPGAIQKIAWTVLVKIFVEVFIKHDVDIQFIRQRGLNKFSITFPSNNDYNNHSPHHHYEEEQWNEPNYY